MTSVFNFGLGIQVDGTEESVTRIEGVINSVEGLDGAVAHIGKTSNSTAQDWRGDLRDIGSDFSAMGSMATGVLTDIGAGASAVGHSVATLGTSISGAITGGLFHLEEQMTVLTARMGEAEGAGRAYASHITDVSMSTGVASGIVGDLANSLDRAGFNFRGMSEQDTEFLTKLAGDFNLGAEGAKEFAQTAKLMGVGVTDLREDFLVLEELGIPGLGEEMTGSFQTVTATMAKFGKAIVGDARRATMGIGKMTKQFVKGLGVSVPKAAQMARAHFSAFAGEASSFEDVFLGLSDSFSPLQMAFLEAGQGVGDLERMLNSAKDSPKDFIAEMEAIQSTLDPQMARRFEKQVLANLPEATAQIIAMEEARKVIAEDRSAAEVEEAKKRLKAMDQQQAFTDLVGKTRASAGAAFRIFQNMFGAFKEAAGLEFAEGLQTGLIDLSKFLGKAFRGFRDFVSFVKGEGTLEGYGETVQKVAGAFKGFFERTGVDGKTFAKTIGVVATAAIGLGPVFASISAILTPFLGLISPIGSMLISIGKRIFDFVKGPAATGAKGLTGFKGSLKALGGVLRRIAIPIGIAMAAFEPLKELFGDVGKILSDDTKTPMEKFKSVISEGLESVWQTFDNFFLGLPGRFVEGWRNVGEKQETEGARSMGESVGKIITNVTEVIADKVQEWWGAFTGWASVPSNWADLLMKLVSGFAAIGDQILAFFGGVGEGILSAFGLPFEALGPLIQTSWLKTQKFFVVSLIEIGDFFMSLITGMGIAWTNFGAGFDESWKNVVFSLSHGFRLFVAGALASMAQLAQAALDNAAALGITSDAAQSAVDSINDSSKAVVGGAALRRAEHAAELERIETERAATNASLVAGQDAREAATRTASADFDRRIQVEQDKLDQLATMRAESEASATNAALEQQLMDESVNRQIANGLPFIANRDLAGVPGAPAQQESPFSVGGIVSSVISPIDTSAAASPGQVGERAAAVSAPEVSSRAQLSSIEPLMSTSQMAQAGSDTGRREIVSHLVFTADAASKLGEALTEMEIDSVEGNR